MRLTKKLNEWRHENIIDKATAEKILHYEQRHRKPMVLWAFGGMGVFAVIVGLVSVIAANWAQTPDWVKLAVDLLACLALAVSLYIICTKDHSNSEKLWLREMLVVMYYGLVLASMALIGQIYQLGGTVNDLLLWWTLITLPLVLLARGRFIAALWLIASGTTYYLNLETLYDSLRYQTGLDGPWLRSFIYSLYVLAPLFFILLSRIPWLITNRLQVAEVISRLSWVALVVSGFFYQFLWYEDITGEIPQQLLVICSAVCIALIYFIPRLYAKESADVHLAMRVVLAVILILGLTASWYSVRLELVGALTNLFYLCMLAWAAIKVHSTSLFNFFTAAICIRILVIYFEVFGSMMETGLGLISGGVLTLLISWWWFKRSNRLAIRLAGEGPDEK